MKRVLAALVALMLCGCSFMERLKPPVLPPLLPAMPANVRLECDPIDTTPIKDMGGLLDAHTSLVGQYAECAARNHSKPEWYDKIKATLEKKP